MSRGFERFGPGSPPSQLPSRLKPFMELSIDTTLEAGLDYTLPLYGTVDVDVDWGDGTQNSYTTTGDKTHTYAAEGTYYIRISGTLTQFGDGNEKANVSKLTACGSWGALGLTALNGAFYGADNLTAVPGWLPSGVTSAYHMLRNASSFNDPAVLTWDVSNITNLGVMLSGALAFNQPIGVWVTSSLTNASYMLENSGFDQDLSSWDVADVTTFNKFLRNVTLSTANYDALLIGWESQAVNDSVSFHGGNSLYTPGGAAEAARTALVNDHLWSITDGGPVV